MKPTDYPALFLASDRVASAAQKIYFRLMSVQLLLLFVVSVTDSIAVVSGPKTRPTFALATAVILGSIVTLMWVLEARHYEKTWFDCRAVAESVKTATWRYMMHASRYESPTHGSDVDTYFLNNLAEIRRARPGIDEHLAGVASTSVELTDTMRAIRGSPFEARKDFYLRNRLHDQHRWYDSRARANRIAKSVWFWVISLLQVFALALAILQSALDMQGIALVSILMTVIASSVAWSQTRRYEDLANSYGLAAQELHEMGSISTTITDLTSLRRFVLATESIISREHTMWSARRNISLEPHK